MLHIALLLMAADPAQADVLPAWLGPTLFGLIAAFMSWLFNALLTSVKTNLMQEIARVDTNTRACTESRKLEAAALATAQERIHQIQLELRGTASQESVRDMERDLTALIREEMGLIQVQVTGIRSETAATRADIAALSRNINGGKSAS